MVCESMPGLAKELSLTGTTTTGIRTLNRKHIGAIITYAYQEWRKGVVTYTWIYGDMNSERFQTGIMSIIKMAISTITTSLTLSASPEPVTSMNTVRSSWNGVIQTKGLHIFPASETRQKNGTRVQRGLRGIQSTESEHGPYASRWMRRVSCVVRCLRHLEKLLITARATATIEDTKETARIAARSSGAAQKARRHALSTVQRCFDGPKEKVVYNLRVESGEYFANCILTHNCDALAHAYSYLARQPSPSRVATTGTPRGSVW